MLIIEWIIPATASGVIIYSDSDKTALVNKESGYVIQEVLPITEFVPGPQMLEAWREDVQNNRTHLGYEDWLRQSPWGRYFEVLA